MPRPIPSPIIPALTSSLGLLLVATLGCSIEGLGRPHSGAEVADGDEGSGTDDGGSGSGSDESYGGSGSDGGVVEADGTSSGGSDDDGSSSESGSSTEDAHTYEKSITFSASEVSGTDDLLDFPVFVSLLDRDLHDRAQEDGCDIAFYQGSTRLDFELEEFDRDRNATEAKLSAWVRVPVLSATEDTEISLRYGLPCDSYENPIGVWGGDYELVWHMGASADSQIEDSTINDFDGTLHGEPVIEDGKLGRALMLDGIDDRVEGPYASELGIHGSAARTFSVWASIQNYDATSWGSIFGIGRMGGGCCLYNGYGINRGSSTLSFSVGGEWIQNANWSIFEDGTGFDEWAHYAAVYDGDSSLRIYANGQLIHEAVLDAPLNTLDTNPLWLPHSENYIIGGPRDEMRISRRALSGEWLMTEYANQNDPGSFYEVGPEITVSVP